LIWTLDSCDCIIECDAPSIAGKFIQRCNFPAHKNAQTTIVVYAHNKLFNKEIDIPARELEFAASKKVSTPPPRPSRP